MPTRKVRLPPDRSAFFTAERFPAIRGSTIPAVRKEEEEYGDMWAGRALNEVAADRPRAEKAVRKLYEACGLSAPDCFMWVKSPKTMLRVETAFLEERENPMATKAWTVVQNVRKHLSVKDAGPYWYDFLAPRMNGLLSEALHRPPRAWELSSLNTVLRAIARPVVEDMVNLGHQKAVPNPIKNLVSPGTTFFEHARAINFLAGQFSAGFVGTLLSPESSVAREKHVVVNALADLVSAASFWFPFRGFCVMSERPTKIALDENARLHNLRGPALEWPDGHKLYAVAGISVDPTLIEFPELLNVDRIDDEDNAEVRRALITLYGEERFLRDSGAEIVNYGRKGAKLWSRPFANDDEGRPFQMVEVLNSTPEPDGTFKTYFLRVPPTVKTADEGIAWTFDVDPKVYNPQRET